MEQLLVGPRRATTPAVRAFKQHLAAAGAPAPSLLLGTGWDEVIRC